MTYKLFLDDVKNPVHCVTYMHQRIGHLNPIYLQNEWVICRNYTCFCSTIEEMGLPEFVSFDHDLADIHYAMDEQDWKDYEHSADREETGLDCAKFLVDYCMDNKLKLPKYAVHSMNPGGTENILSYLKLAEKWL